MSKVILKKGDRISGCVDGKSFTGVVYEIKSENCGTIKRDDGKQGSGCDIPDYGSGWKFDNLENYNLKLISTNKNNMTLIEKFALMSKGEPEKSFIKTGVMEMNGKLTEDGKQLFLMFLLKKFGPEFKTEVVDGLSADTKED